MNPLPPMLLTSIILGVAKLAFGVSGMSWWIVIAPALLGVVLLLAMLVIVAIHIKRASDAVGNYVIDDLSKLFDLIRQHQLKDD